VLDTTHCIPPTVTLTTIDPRPIVVNREPSVQKWPVGSGRWLLLLAPSTHT